MMDIAQQINNTITKLHIPENLRDDAFQEGWLAHCEGKSIMSHLKQWLRKEKRYSEHEHPFDPSWFEKMADNWALVDDPYQGLCREEDV